MTKEDTQNHRNILFQLIRRLSTIRSIDDITTLVTKTARDAIGCDGVTFVLLDGELCHYYDENAISPLWKGQRFQARLCISGWAMIHREPVVIEDVSVDPRIPYDSYKPTFVKSLMMAPVIGENSLAAIGCYWATHHRPTDDERNFMLTLCDSVSVAMQNVMLYDELNKRIAELQKATQDKDNFLMTLSHELRTPLSAVLGWTQILQTSTDMTKVESDEALKTIERNAAVQLKLIEDLINANSIFMGRFVLSKSIHEPYDFINQAIENVRTAASDKNITIEVRRSTRFGQIKCDLPRFQQAIHHLLSNAIKFTPPGGNVAMTVKRFGPSASIEISDTGCGIESEILKTIFDRFSQADNTTRRVYGGLGLGLSLAKAIIEAHRGTIEVVSNGKNRGTMFTIRLPLDRILELSTSNDESHMTSDVYRPLVSTPATRVG